MSSASHGDISSSSLTPATSTSSPGTDPPHSKSEDKDNKSSKPLPLHQSAASYFSYPVTHVVSGLYRRLTDPPTSNNNNNNGSNMMSRLRRNNPDPSSSSSSISSTSQHPVFTPVRTVSPFQPPPLTPLTLLANEDTNPVPLAPQHQLLTRALAEEIRLLVPPRLQLVDTWRLAYSLDRDGASLSTLYENCRAVSNRSPRAGYVLVIRDASPSATTIFGAYMTDPPHPDSHYFGTGECFLWRASVLRPPPPPSLLGSDAGGDGVGDGGVYSEEALKRAGFPPPPSADTTNVGRSTTLRGDKLQPKPIAPYTHALVQANPSSGATTPDRIRFKAFPYSGVNDYMMFCETGFLSLGGGDGHYGLWLDSILEKGVSASSQTFGNEPLSDEGVKFDVIGVEVWYVGS
ncbi:putative oxidative stress response protein Oxr1 [Aspergillus undulatus]|uniref:putative oxidative stress response protein Oxr1 n=1 Tax=Aspergillus undulatus TaxID=1810928 RepID=UPI003CCDD0F5